MREYEQQRADSSEAPPSLFFDAPAARLADAGAREALGRDVDALTQWGLVQALNHWGYWQSRGRQPGAGIATLQRIVAMAPTRAVAWRNLGDAARASLSGSLTDAGITSTVDADLSGSGQRNHVGSFVGHHPDGDCHFGGVMLLNGEQRQDSARNTTLRQGNGISVTAGAPRRRWSATTATQMWKSTAGALREHGEIPGRTLQHVTGTGAGTMCRIVERPAYTPTGN